jgi:internalin A
MIILLIYLIIITHIPQTDCNSLISKITNLKKLSKSDQISSRKISLKYNEVKFVLSSRQLKNDYQLIKSKRLDLNYKISHIDIKLKSAQSNSKRIILKNSKISDLTNLKLPFNLEEIDLSYNEIRILNLNGNFSNLKRFYLNNNKIELWQETSLNISLKLEYLDLSFNRLKNIVFLEKNFYNLKHLILSNNEIEDIKPLSSLNNLINIYLSNNSIKNIDCLSSSESQPIWKSINSLFLSYNQITNISSLKHFTELTTLFLGNNQIKDINPLTEMTNLRQLELSSNGLKDMEPVKNLIRLILLDLDVNQIEDISWLKYLTKLRILELSRNKIRFIPNGLFDDLNYLSEIHLGFNLIKQVNLFGSFLENNLIRLDLSNNMIEKINVSANFTALDEFKISNNLIADINSIRFDYRKLKTIDLSFNRIKSFNTTEIKNIGKQLTTILIDADSIELFKNIKNDRILKKNTIYTFYKSLNIITKSQLDFVDCQLQLKYLKNMIQLNMLYSFQIENIFSNCKILL